MKHRIPFSLLLAYWMLAPVAAVPAVAEDPGQGRREREFAAED